ncbi:hypothetical protein Pan241w_07910 [Gimesia alba]|uniref:Uncharacterized protein n=1 Tax=Gimesia alba TaxID=2527973 RepID=A0A517RAC3_9PLAN|nr:hypothetical protein Pan241w_07910 [Gimesia alba]
MCQLVADLSFVGHHWSEYALRLEIEEEFTQK